jgi:hypothetical protein
MIDSFTFSVKDFLSPPTNQPSDPINMTSYIDGSSLDICTTYVTNLSPKPITNISIINSKANDSSMIVNGLYTIKFLFTISDTLATDDTVTVVFPVPSSLTLDISQVASSFSVLATSTKYNSTNGTLSIYMTSSRTYSSNTQQFLNVGNYTAPPTTLTTDDFTISIFRNGYIKMIGAGNLAALPSKIDGMISMLSTTINVNTSYTFTITTYDALNATGKIVIRIPPEIGINISEPTCASVKIQGFTVFPTCTYDRNANNITLTNINASNSAIYPQTIIITINGLVNPMTIVPSS